MDWLPGTDVAALLTEGDTIKFVSENLIFTVPHLASYILSDGHNVHIPSTAPTYILGTFADNLPEFSSRITTFTVEAISTTTNVGGDSAWSSQQVTDIIAKTSDTNTKVDTLQTTVVGKTGDLKHIKY